jgi:hypothetical protein
VRDPDEVLDRPGEWEIRVTVYRNGRRVGTCDTTGHETFASAAYFAAEGLNTRAIDLHQPRPRTGAMTTRPTGPQASEPGSEPR